MTRRHYPWLWPGCVIGLALLFSVPLLTVFSFVLHPTGEVWHHLADTVLAEYLFNSMVLMLGVACGVLLLGVPGAWLTSACEFPGRRVFEWALLLPMAIPAFIIAYTYTGMLDSTGPLQIWLREQFEWRYGEYWFPEIRSLGGAVTMLSLVLYPYVFMMARAAFLEQSTCILEVTRSLGAGSWSGFFRMVLPLARPAIVAGLLLALMETLADYGTVQYFGIHTFTTGIFRTWFGLGDSAAAAQLSALLMTFVLILILAEQHTRRQGRYHHTSTRFTRLHRIKLTGWWRWAAFATCALPVCIGFIIPTIQLTVWALRHAEEVFDAEFLTLFTNSLALAASASITILLLALFMAYSKRLYPRISVGFAVRLAAMGYAIPGAVLAVGVGIPFAWLDNHIDGWLRTHLDLSTGLLFSGTIFTLLFAYAVRFLAVSLGALDAGLGKIKPSMEDAARTLGASPARTFLRLHLPIMRTTLITALLLVFVDVLKELPATLFLRPFNFNTLAVRAYELASDERLPDSSTAALSIIAAGLIPVILLSRSIRIHDTAAEH